MNLIVIQSLPKLQLWYHPPVMASEAPTVTTGGKGALPYVNALTFLPLSFLTFGCG